MRRAPARILREAALTARSQPIVSAVVAVAAAAMVATGLASVGRVAVLQADILSRLSTVEARTVTVSTTETGTALPRGFLTAVSGLDVVETVVGLGPARDARNAAVPREGTPVAVWPLFGDLDTVGELEDGREPAGPGEAVLTPAAARVAGLAGGLGPLRSDPTLARLADVPAWDLAVVGAFRPTVLASTLGNGGVRPAGPGDELTRVAIVVGDVAAVDALVARVPALLGDPGGVAVESSAELAALRRSLETELGSFSTTVTAGVSALGMAVVGIVVFAGVGLRQRDFGRRRALGASRGTLFGLVLAQTLLPALAGLAAGAGAGTLIVVRLAGSPPAGDLVAAFAVLDVLAVAAAAAVPALVAAFRDPVRALRVP